jgi:transposase
MKKTGSTLEQLHLEYLMLYPKGVSYSRFCTLYREYKITLKRSLRQVHIAGEKVFVDYAGPTISIHNMQNGDVREAQIFVGVLGASNYIYAEATWNQRKENWIASHVRMFEHFGGVPLMVICDNLKSAVTKPSRTEPIIQTSYKDMASHYGTSIFPARAYKPKDKAKAENGVLIVERWILFRIRKHVFTSLSELNEKISEMIQELNNRPFQKLPGCRMSAFCSMDKPALKPLNAEPYEYTEFHKIRAGFDYHVQINEHFYSVPNQLVGKSLEARITASTIEILYAGKRVASHARSDIAGKTTDSNHMPDSHKHFTKWNVQNELEWGLTVGPYTHAFLEVLFAKASHRDFGYRWANSVKKLFREYGDERLEAACKLAVAVGANKTSNLLSILKNNLDQRGLHLTEVKEASFEHENIRGADYYH